MACLGLSSVTVALVLLLTLWRGLYGQLNIKQRCRRLPPPKGRSVASDTQTVEQMLWCSLLGADSKRAKALLLVELAGSSTHTPVQNRHRLRRYGILCCRSLSVSRYNSRPLPLSAPFHYKQRPSPTWQGPDSRKPTSTRSAAAACVRDQSAAKRVKERGRKQPAHRL